MPQLDYSTYLMQIVWLVVVFGLLYAFVKFLFIPRIAARIKIRAAMIEDALSQSESMLTEANRLRGEITKVLGQVREYSVALQLDSDEKIKAMLDASIAESQQMIRDLLSQEEKKLLEIESSIRQEMPAMAEEIKLEILKFFDLGKTRGKKL